MSELDLDKYIRGVNSSESAISVSREILSKVGLDSTLEVLHVSYLTGKAHKALLKNVDGWLISFKLLVAEGSSPNCMWVELYPHLGEFHIPDIW
jgi:hypothetical protein